MALADCCEIVSGATPSTSVDDYWDGDICWATPKDLSDLDGHYISDTPRKLTQDGLSSCAATLLPPNSVLFSSRAPIGHVAVNTVPMATNQGFKSFVPKADIIEAKFLFHWLRANRAFLESLGVGATFKEVSKAIVARIQIPLPPLPEQRRIAAILDQADALRAKRREALAELDQLTQSIFIEMFGDPVANPKQWPTKPLCEVTSAINDCPHSTPLWTESGVVCLRTSNLTKGGWDFSDTRFVSEDDYHERSKRGYISSGDIILSREGTVGIAAIVQESMKVCMGQRLVQVRPEHKCLKSEYLLHHFLHVLSPSKISHLMVGSTSQHINVKELRTIKTPLPPLELQQSFTDRVSAIRGHSRKSISSLQEISSLFSSLQHRAFRGEL